MADPHHAAGAGTRGVDADARVLGPNRVAAAAPRSPSPIVRRERVAFYGRSAFANHAHAVRSRIERKEGAPWLRRN